MESIFETLDYWVNRDPQKLLFSFLDSHGHETERYTYQAFLDRIRTIATHLVNDYGFQSGDRVMLAFPAGLEMICAFFGCARAGLIPVPAYPPTSHSFVAAVHKMVHIAQDCEATGLLLSREYFRALRLNISRNGESTASAAKLASLKWIVSEDLNYRTTFASCPPNEILFLQYTSGSTSNPKGVMVTHENVLHNRTLVADHASPVAVSWLPQYHDMGLIGYYLYSALSGGTTYGFSPMDFIQRPRLWLDSIKQYRASATSAPNFAFDYCLRSSRLSDESLENADLSSLKFLMTAGEPVRPVTYSRFLQKFQPFGLKPESFFAAYGLAENTLAVSSHGRNVLSINRSDLSILRVRAVSAVSEIAASKQIVSCGKALGDVVVKIVDPISRVAVEDEIVGEIWVAGKSKCLGYWNSPELTRESFYARVAGSTTDDVEYLRTGDLGFMYREEIYVCGRLKDMIVIRGQNYYPQDIEQIVEDSSELIRRNCVAAFEIDEDEGEVLAVVAEVASIRALPDPRSIASAIRRSLNIDAAMVALIAPRTVPKTSSGKVMRHLARQMWIEGGFQVLNCFSARTASPSPHGANSAFDVLKTRYNLSGSEGYSLIEAGVDSIDLVLLMHEIKERLKQSGAGIADGQIDVRLIQQITIADLFLLADLFERSPEAAVTQIRQSMSRMIHEHRDREERLMKEDSKLAFTLPRAAYGRHSDNGGILLTGGSGFFGPFLLESLLRQTRDTIYVLVRASGERCAGERLRAGLESIGPVSSASQEIFNRRVIPVCGDLTLPNLGLAPDRWSALEDGISNIYHNGAAVNYLLNYEMLRSANVSGTNEVLRFALSGRPKTLNYISTTFIFGWAVKEILFENDCNQRMELLDFGYSQSKWVAEQVVMDAARRGLRTRIFRPALISPSIEGGGNNLDIATRLLAFMVNHGIGVEALNQVSFVPADIAANNIVAISRAPHTNSEVFHLTRDDFASMMDITGVITRLTGRQFEMFGIPAFVPEVIKRCTKHDPLFPLLDFLIGSVDSIASMEFKRYDSSSYRAARDSSPECLPDPSLEDTVRGILRFMERKKLIALSSSVLKSHAGRGDRGEM